MLIGRGYINSNANVTTIPTELADSMLSTQESDSKLMQEASVPSVPTENCLLRGECLQKSLCGY